MFTGISAAVLLPRIGRLTVQLGLTLTAVAAAAYGHAFSRTLWISIGLLNATLVASCILPRRTVAAPSAAEPVSSARNDARLRD